MGNGAGHSRISEAWRLPAPESMIRQVPFAVRDFYTDNGGEFINGVVAQLLAKLHIEKTKSPRHFDDNGLIETKNVAIVRKHIGWGQIDPAERHNCGQMEIAPAMVRYQARDN